MMSNNWEYTTNGSTIILNPKIKPDASIIWLHGLGASAEDLAGIPPQLNISQGLNIYSKQSGIPARRAQDSHEEHTFCVCNEYESKCNNAGNPRSQSIRHIFPNAPSRRVTFAEGMMMNAWFDIIDLSLTGEEDESGIRKSNEIIEELIANELQSGILSERIILAGFSQGGAMALYSGLRYKKTLGGIMALSSFIPLRDKLPKEKSLENAQIPILLAHGKYDPLISVDFSEVFYSYLTNLGYQTKLNIYNMAHEICPAEIADISEWISNKLLYK